MPFVKNIAFTLLLKVSGQLREFNFRKRKDDLYDGDTSDTRGTRYFFKMTKLDTEWKMEGTDLPTWLREMSILISEEIKKKEAAI